MGDKTICWNNGPGSLHHHSQDLKFLAAERLDLVLKDQLVGGAVQDNGTNSKQIGQIGVLSTEHGPDPGQKLGGGKRFGQVVVCSSIQTLYPLRNFCAGGQKQSWGFDSVPTQSLQYLQPVQAGHHNV